MVVFTPWKKTASALFAAGLQSMPRISTKTARSRTETQTTTKRKKRALKSNSLKKQMLSMKPAFHDTVSDNTLTTTLAHNNMYVTSPTQAVGQGTDNTSRIGDEIYLEAMKFRATIHTPDTTGGFVYRIIVGYSGEEINCPTSFTSIAQAEIFLPGTGDKFRTNGINNPKAFTVLYDSTIDFNSLVANTQEVRTVEDTIQLKTKFPYQASGSQYGKNRNLYVAVMGIKIGGITGVTTTGDVFINCDLIFKNC